MSPHAQSPEFFKSSSGDEATARDGACLPALSNGRRFYEGRKAEDLYAVKHRNSGGARHNGSANDIDADAAKPLHDSLIGQSPSMLRLRSLIERIAPTHNSVLIKGATGTGKELVAHAIHRQSPRHRQPFIDINCSAIPDALFESELFGFQRGSFTNAVETRRGLLEEASGGILFLDEIDSLSLAGQAKLLRVLQESYVRRVGGRENIPINVRIISATSRDLQQAVSEGSFRGDLLFRLSVMPLYVPGLLERGEADLRTLIDHFLLKNEARYSMAPRRFSSEAGDALARHPWPGNVRELENAIAYALAVGVDEELGIGDLPPGVLEAIDVQPVTPKQCTRRLLSLADTERRYILFVLESFDGNQSKTANALDIDLRTLSRKLKQYRAMPEAFCADD